MVPCISQATTLSTSFADDIVAYAEGGCQSIEVWLTKLEQHLQTHSVEQTRALLAERQINLVVASYQGGLLLSQGEQRAAHFDHFKQRLGLCQGLGIGLLTVVADFVGQVEPVGLERAVVSLKQAAQWAQAFDVSLALEFRSRGTFCTCLPTALSLVEAAEEENLGVCLDVFHYYTGPSKYEDLGLIRPGRLKLVQVCDVAGVARELATDGDRIFPGEGDFQLRPLIDHLKKIGYTGPVSLELFNPELWKVKPAHLVQLAMSALQRLVG